MRASHRSTTPSNCESCTIAHCRLVRGKATGSHDRAAGRMNAAFPKQTTDLAAAVSASLLTGESLSTFSSWHNFCPTRWTVAERLSATTFSGFWLRNIVLRCYLLSGRAKKLHMLDIWRSFATASKHVFWSDHHFATLRAC